MREEKTREHRKEGRHRGERHKRGEGSPQRGAKTFRRGRALTFLERLNLKRATIIQQLEKPEFQSIHPILVGELKALDEIINEFIQLFELHEDEAGASIYTDEATAETDTEEVESNDTN